MITQRVKVLVKAAKDEVWKKFVEELEEAGQGMGKKFWSTIKDIRRGGEKEGCGSILDKDGPLVTEEGGILKAWQGYFQNRLPLSTRWLIRVGSQGLFRRMSKIFRWKKWLI